MMDNHPQTKSDNVWYKRITGYLLVWIAWGCIFCLLLVGVVIVYRPLAAAVIFAAKTDIPIYTVLTKGSIESQETRQEGANTVIQVLPDNGTVVKQQQLLIGHITLHNYAKGDVIRLSDLGPKLSLQHHYQVRTILTAVSATLLHPGDTVNLNLLDNSSPPVTTSWPALHILMNVVIVQLVELKKDGTLHLLIAIPREENQALLPLLDQMGDSLIAFPEVNVP